MPCDVFMSYTRLKDIDGKVTDLRAHLEERLSDETKRDIRIFQDTQIEAGAPWKAVLRDEIRSAKIFLLLLSPNWLNSQYCNIEFQLALSGDKWIVPLLWEQTSNDLSQNQKEILSQVSERQILIADRFRDANWAKLNETRDEALGKLVQALKPKLMTVGSVRSYDEALLRQAFEVARRSRAGGDHPFGSVLADGQGKLLMEQGNGYTSEGHDRTAHAERLLASRAARAYDLEFLKRCTLYTSAEPCAMCAGAIYWAGIGRVVYGQTEKALKTETGAHEENPTLDLPCDIVFAAGQRTTEVVGPMLEDEAAELHAGFWTERR
jgi:tRNA(Arg) A34 adenosine deaminase TadA